MKTLNLIKSTIYKVYRVIFDRFTLICRSGGLGRNLQICGYIGGYSKLFIKRNNEWDDIVSKILKDHKGIRVWTNAEADRIGEYIARFRKLARISEENKDGYYNVEYDKNYERGNKALSWIMDRKIPVICSENVTKWNYILRRIPDIDWSHFEPIDKDDDRVFTYQECRDWFLLSKDEEEYCHNKMAEMGLTEPFVCFSSRDSRYLEKNIPWRDYSYHNYRDSSIENKSLMIEYLSSKGIRSVRMGKDMAHRFVHGDSIDFSFDHYDDLMDIYLHEHAKFVVEDMNGLIEIPMTNNGNVVVTNLTPLTDDWKAEVRIPNCIAIFKKEYSHRLGRLLTLDEMLEVERIARYDGKKYAELGIEMIENTPEEILNATIEMNDRLEGVWIEKEEDLRLQSLFDEFKIRMMDKMGYSESQLPSVKIGTKFLKDNMQIFALE